MYTYLRIFCCIARVTFMIVDILLQALVKSQEIVLQVAVPEIRAITACIGRP